MSSFRLGKDITQFYLQDNNPVRYTEMDISGTDTVGFNFYNGNGGNQSQFNISNGHLKYSRTSGSLFRELPISVNGTYADATGNINISAGGASQWRDTTGGIYYPLGSASIGTTLANTSAKLDVQGTTKGVLLPRLTNAQMLAIASPANGLMVTNTDSLNRIFIYNGAIWRGLAFTNEMAYGGASVDTSLLVHKAGIETITGSKYFTPDINVNGFNIGRGNSNIQTNIAVGDSVLASNTTGTYNSALGFKVLARNTTGGFNSAMGEGALTGNLAGNSNVAIGALALNVFGSAGGFASSNVAIGTQALANATYNPTSGPNVAIGTGAMQFTTTGDINTAVGTQSLYSNTTGANNSALGYWSLHFNTTGSENMGVGTTSLRQNTTGNRNVGIGREAMRTNSTGSGNVGIGYQVGYSSIGNYNVYLGYQAGYYNKADNKLYISNSSTTTPLIYGDFSNGYLSVNNSSTSADTLNSVFSVYSTTKGMYMPRLTEAQMLAIVSPAAGLMITNTDSLNRIFIYTGSAWKGLAYTSEGGSSGGWGLTGNAGTNTTSNFIGTTDNNGLAFRTNNTARLLINPAGNVGIGTVNISDTTYKLFVEKGIRTRKLKVDAASIVWADYVFDKDYKLTSLPELDKFIQQHKHLPGVQSTAEINKNGIDVGENQAVLLKKIEELTLYIIEQDKKAEVQQVTLSQQKNTSADQQQQIDNLKKQMDELKLLIQKKQ